MAKSNKVLIIGLDGGTFDIIKPLVNAGKLPTMGGMIKEGCHGILRSTIPPVTAPAWASFLTGKNPGKHGVYDFTYRKAGSYEQKVIDRTRIKSKTICELAAESGSKVVSINVPLTYPPFQKNGIAISGMLTPPDANCCYPPELFNKLKKMDYIVDIPCEEIPSNRWLYRFVLKMTERRFKVAKELLRSVEWDLFIVVFVGTDRLQHQMLEDTEKLSEYFVKLDNFLGELIETAGKETYSILMSDHGFTRTPRTFYVNEWLSRIGFLRKGMQRGEAPFTHFFAMRNGVSVRSESYLYKFLKKIGFNSAAREKIIPAFIWNKIVKIVPHYFRGHIPKSDVITIDRKNTKAYFTSQYGFLTINLKGREPFGIVEKGECAQVEKILTEKLLGMRDPQTGDEVIENVYRGEKLYSGEFAKEAPDLIVVPMNMSYFLEGGKSHEKIIDVSKKTRYWHHWDGIFVVSGPDIESNKTVENISIIDLAPTVLHILNVPLPEDMDGKVIREVFEEKSELKHREETTQPSSQKYEGAFERADEEEKELQARLRGLGYLS